MDDVAPLKPSFLLGSARDVALNTNATRDFEGMMRL